MCGGTGWSSDLLSLPFPLGLLLEHGLPGSWLCPSNQVPAEKEQQPDTHSGPEHVLNSPLRQPSQLDRLSNLGTHLLNHKMAGVRVPDSSPWGTATG